MKTFPLVSLFLGLFLSSCFTIHLTEVQEPEPKSEYHTPVPLSPALPSVPEEKAAVEEVLPLPVDDMAHYEEAIPQNLDRIQVALILDTSGSMEDLLEHAKLEFWYIIDELMTSYPEGEVPLLEIALYEYGNSFIGSSREYVRQVVPLTSDLDWIGDKLWSLRSKGEYEYDGLAVDRAVHELAWSRHPDDLKLIYIFGNETFRDGPVNPHDAIEAACLNNISVHTIFCGNYQKGLNLGWEEVAWCGSYAALDMHAIVNEYVSSYDPQICALNSRINDTYLPYGEDGGGYYDRCVRQDRNLESYGPAWLSVRTVVKSGPFYANPGWDLIDAIDCGQIRLIDLPQTEWPRSIRGKSLEEAEVYIRDLRQKRRQLQSNIHQLNQERRKEIRMRTPSSSERQKKYHSMDRLLAQSIRGEVEVSTRRPNSSSKRFRDIEKRKEEAQRLTQVERQKQEIEEKARQEQIRKEQAEEVRRLQQIQRRKQEVEAKAKEEQIRKEQAEEVRRLQQIQLQKREAEIKLREEQVQREREAEVRRQEQIQRQKREAEAKAQAERAKREREAEARRQEQIQRQKLESEAKARAEEAHRKREAEARRQEQIQRQKREAEAKARAEEARRKREAEARRQEQIQRQKREAETKAREERAQREREAEAKAREERAQREREAEARRQEQIQRQKREAEAKARAEEARRKREAEARRQEQIQRQKREAEAKARAEEARRKREAEARRQEQIQRQKRETEARARAEEARRKREAEARRQEQIQRQKREAEAKARAEEAQRKREAEARRKNQIQQQQARQKLNSKAGIRRK